MLRVEVADVTADWAVLGEPLRAETVPGEPLAWSDPWPRLVGDTAAYGTGRRAPGRAARRGARCSCRAPTWPPRSATAPLAGTWAAEALRIAAWRPRLGFETDHRTIAHEVDWLRTAVHLHKGCYRGQETVARVHNLGRPPRRLVFLHLDGSGHTLPARGDAASSWTAARSAASPRSAGTTRTARSRLALVKRNTALDAVLTTGSLTAAQTEVVAR